MIESKCYEDKHALSSLENTQSKLNADLAEVSNEVQKVRFFQERLDTLGDLFKGTEFRLGCVENDVGSL